MNNDDTQTTTQNTTEFTPNFYINILIYVISTLAIGRSEYIYNMAMRYLIYSYAVAFNTLWVVILVIRRRGPALDSLSPQWSFRSNN